jgi:hypothetical protein
MVVGPWSVACNSEGMIFRTVSGIDKVWPGTAAPFQNSTLVNCFSGLLDGGSRPLVTLERETHRSTRARCALFLDGATNAPEVFAEGGAVVAALFEVVGEVRLGPETRAPVHAGCLKAFCFADRTRSVGNVLSAAERQKEHSIIVGEHEVFRGDDLFADGSCGEGIGLLVIEALRAGSQGTLAENWYPDSAQLGAVPVEPPDDDSSKASFLRFEGDEVANACFVEAAPVIHDEHIAWFGFLDGFEEDVDASIVLGRERPSYEMDALPERPYGSRRGAHGDPEPHDRVGHVRCSEVEIRTAEFGAVHCGCSFTGWVGRSRFARLCPQGRPRRAKSSW